MEGSGGKSNICVIGSPERGHWKNRGEAICKEKKAEHFPKSRKDRNTCTKGAQQIQRRINKRKLEHTKNRSKEQQGRKDITYKGMTIS